MASRISAFVVWAVVALSAAFWGLRLFAQSQPVPAQALPVSLEQAVRGDILRLFPAPPEQAVLEPALASRFQLLGVIAPREAADGVGVALISMDGKPPKAYRVGSRIEGQLVLQSVTQRGAAIGPAGGGAAAQLSAPSLPPPATGSLPSTAGMVQVGDGSDGGSNAPPQPAYPPAGMAQPMPGTTPPQVDTALQQQQLQRLRGMRPPRPPQP